MKVFVGVVVGLVALIVIGIACREPETLTATNATTASSNITPATSVIQSSLRIPEDIPNSPIPAVAAKDIRANSHQYDYGQIIHVYGEMVELYRHGGECFALLEAGVALEYKSCDSLLYWEVGETIAALCTMGQYNPRAQGDITTRTGYQLTHNCDTPPYVRDAQSP